MAPDITAEQAEDVEAESLFDLVAATSPAARTALGVATVRLGGGVVLAAPGDPTGFLNRAVGLGGGKPAGADLVAEACAFLREHGVKAAVMQFAPSTLPADWERILAEENIERRSTMVKVAGEVDRILAIAQERPALPRHLRLAPVEPDQALEWSRTRLRAGGVPDDEHFTEVMAACVGRSDWYSFGVWDGETLVAGATTYTHGDVGRLLGAATVPEARGQGAQAALIAARARAAAEAGIRWLVTEVGTDGDYASGASLRNMLRHGFEVLYERPNWIWHAD